MLDVQNARLEGEQTVSRWPIKGRALGALLLIGACAAQARVAIEVSAYRGLQGDSAQALYPCAVTEADVLRALVELHDSLLGSQQELSPEAGRILYENLWQLYG